MAKDWAWTTGTVNLFSGALGLLETMLAYVLGTEVTAENLSGSGTSWSGTLANYPCGLGRLVLKYTISAVDYEVTDDGSGALAGTGISAGSITYATGVYSVTFTSTPTGTPTFDYLYGDPGQDWRLLMQQDTQDDSLLDVSWVGLPVGEDPTEVIIQNTGKTGTEDIIIGFREWFYKALDYHGWDLNCYTVYNDGMGWNANSGQHGRTAYNDTYEHWNNHPMLPLIDDLMTYWIHSNRQKIFFAVEVQSNYESIYMGFGRRFGDKDSYPYPLIAKGAVYGNKKYDSVDVYHNFVADNVWSQYGYPLMVVDPQGNFVNSFGTSEYLNGIRILPYNSWVTTTGVIGRTPDDKVLMYPVYLTRPAITFRDLLMDLEDVYLVAGTAVQSEDIVTGAGMKNMIFQNIHRTGNYDFLAVSFATTTTTTTTTTTSSTTTTTV